jgi:hypothetical protein
VGWGEGVVCCLGEEGVRRGGGKEDGELGQGAKVRVVGAWKGRLRQRYVLVPVASSQGDSMIQFEKLGMKKITGAT